LALIWRASEVLEPVFCDFARFAICVPARRSEIARLDWRRIDLDARVWRLVGKATKNRDWHELRLHPLAVEILTRRWEAAGHPKTGVVFPSPLSGTVITAFSGMLRAIHRAAPDVERWALHDLRRSFGSALARLKEYDEETIDGILNHRQSATRGGVRGVYLKSTSMPAQHAALERWGELIANALKGRFPEETEVIPLARRIRP
jgi:integrase